MKTTPILDRFRNFSLASSFSNDVTSAKLNTKTAAILVYQNNSAIVERFSHFILLHEKFLQFDWLRAVVFQLNLKYLHVKITNLLRVVSIKKY